MREISGWWGVFSLNQNFKICFTFRLKFSVQNDKFSGPKQCGTMGEISGWRGVFFENQNYQIGFTFTLKFSVQNDKFSGPKQCGNTKVGKFSVQNDTFSGLKHCGQLPYCSIPENVSFWTRNFLL